jgi:predicted nucleotidyltransferase component of viral defense system
MMLKFLPPETMKIKVEINTREHFSVLGTQTIPFEVKSPWFTGSAQISTYKLEELLATKLRALYQRRKGRDLFDVFYAFQHNEHLQIQYIIQCFHQYLENEGLRVTSKMFEENMCIKINDPLFRSDMKNLLISDYHYDIDEAYQIITEKIIKHL